MIRKWKPKPTFPKRSNNLSVIQYPLLIGWQQYLTTIYYRIEPVNKVEYGEGYYQKNIKNMKTGYVHPYHSSKYPIYFSHLYYMKTLFEAVGPEQVSPHYESLTRSRKGLLFIFLYIGTINSISRFGGWSHNEWLRGMIFHHEFLIAFYLGYSEIRHFTYFLGPKFSIFYNVYTRYETKQLCLMWSDTVE